MWIKPDGELTRDYPRACGETFHCVSQRAIVAGLSPRLRGNLGERGVELPDLGTIPAPAGKPRPEAVRVPILGDYPRACGETVDVEPGITRPPGLSPRLRGNHTQMSYGVELIGTIPAPAGKPLTGRNLHRLGGDYPRACGETWIASASSVDVPGLSPRLRGNRGSTGLA